MTAAAKDWTHEDRWLVVDLGGPCRVASWATVGGGVGMARRVVWHHVRDEELAQGVDARAWFEARLARRGLGDAVGLLTGRRLDRHVRTHRSIGGIDAWCVATVGLSNALRVGDPPGPMGAVGTINAVCRVSVPLSTEALLEALAIAAEARTAAVLECGVASRRSGRPATGTGTDCLVVAAPAGWPEEPYAGKHTAVGALVGGVVESAVAEGVRAWQAEWDARSAADDVALRG